MYGVAELLRFLILEFAYNCFWCMGMPRKRTKDIEIKPFNVDLEEINIGDSIVANVAVEADSRHFRGRGVAGMEGRKRANAGGHLAGKGLAHRRRGQKQRGVDLRHRKGCRELSAVFRVRFECVDGPAAVEEGASAFP